jgi:hypothetical protein
LEPGIEFAQVVPQPGLIVEVGVKAARGSESPRMLGDAAAVVCQFDLSPAE